MVKVKVCGLWRMDDVDYVNELKPDYAGFVFAKSKRQVAAEHARQLVEKLDRDIQAVGIFVNEDMAVVKEIAAYVGLEVLQFHGSETPEYVKAFSGITVWKAAFIKSPENLEPLGGYEVDALLLDSSSAGSGQRFNWDIIKGYKPEKPIILAGGLDPSNIASAVAEVRPYCVDVSSGVETGGFKDYKKIREFIDKARGLG
ncbi:MAG: phosphoribosylanthranilate isomerase [Clostridia bacterium]